MKKRKKKYFFREEAKSISPSESESKDTSENEKVLYSRTSADNTIVMSEELAHFFEDAIYCDRVLNATITTVRNTSMGYCVLSTYVTDYGDICTVATPVEKFGLSEQDVDYINNIVTQRSAGVNLSKSEIQVLYEDVRINYITSMVGATIDFVPTDLVREQNVVVGDREKAMAIMRKTFLPSPRLHVPYNKVGSVVKGRVIRKDGDYRVIEAYGYVVVIPRTKISYDAVAQDDFNVGDVVNLKIVDFNPDDGPTFIGCDVDEETSRKKIYQYKHRDRSLATVVAINPRSGFYYLKMPNGCRGIAYTHATFKGTRNIKMGSKVLVKVIGYKDSDIKAVKCYIEKLI